MLDRTQTPRIPLQAQARLLIRSTGQSLAHSIDSYAFQEVPSAGSGQALRPLPRSQDDIYAEFQGLLRIRQLSLHLLRARSALNVQRADFSFFILHKLNSKIGTEDEELGFRFRDHFEFLSVGFEEELVTFLHHRERLVRR